MKKIKQERGAGSRRQDAIINRVIRKDFPKMTLVQISEGKESYRYLGKAFQTKGKAMIKDLRGRSAPSMLEEQELGHCDCRE